DRLHGGNHAVAVSAPGAQYGKISDALGDYDLGGNDDGEVEVGRGSFFNSLSNSLSLHQSQGGSASSSRHDAYESKEKEKERR
ncbi:MAG: hypothetical protein NT128_04050, partial [Proteobacteria bacterium]|nr:hypothetical protein [Pseudomonadota bacterium]